MTGRGTIVVALVVAVVAGACGLHWVRASNGDNSGGGGGAAMDLAETFKCNVCQVPRLTGEIGDCCCDFETVDDVNREHFLPLLLELTQRTYFRYFKADLWKQCPFWKHEGTCASQHCSVCECDPNEIPPVWLEGGRRAEGEGGCEPGVEESQLSRVTFGEERVGMNFTAWQVAGDAVERDDDIVWTLQDEGPRMKYLNLLVNPERYTGFAGEDAHRVWDAIQHENCFDNIDNSDDEQCLEERVFSRLLSGLHTSISSHLSTKYAYGGDAWGPNLDMYLQKVAVNTDWLKNLYFIYVFAVRALAKAAPLLAEMEYHTGNMVDDHYTKQLVKQLGDVEVPAMLAGFDESRMFKVRREDIVASCPAVVDGLEALEELRQRYFTQVQLKNQMKAAMRDKFRNISRIMDCVTCEKCRLWGKLQFLGVGTALKIVFAEPTTRTDGTEVPDVHLSKNEVVALINVVHQLSRSIYDVQRMRTLEAERAVSRVIWLALVVVALVCVLCCVVRTQRARSRAASEAKPHTE